MRHWQPMTLPCPLLFCCLKVLHLSTPLITHNRWPRAVQSVRTRPASTGHTDNTITPLGGLQAMHSSSSSRSTGDMHLYMQ